MKMVSVRVVLMQVSSVVAIMGVALTFSLGLLACTGPSSTQSPPMSSEQSPSSPIGLKNSSWRLDRWERKGSAVALVPQIEVSLNFESDRVNGFGGCNRFGGSFNTIDRQLSVGTLEATQKGCNPEITNQESQFLAALQSVRRFDSDASGRLVLFYGPNGDEGALYFAPKK